MFWAAVSDKHDIMKYLVTIVKKEKLLELQLTSTILPSWMFFLPASLILSHEFGCSIDGWLPQFSAVNFVEYCLFHKKSNSSFILKLLLEFGAAELAFGEERSIMPLKQYLNEQWFYISQLLDSNIVEHSRKLPLSESVVPRYLDKFSLILQHFGVYKLSTGKKPCLEENVLSLKQLCRFIIRCCVMQK